MLGPFFFWESDIFKTLINNIDEIVSEKIFSTLWKLIANVVYRKIAKTESVNTPLSFFVDKETRPIAESIDKTLQSHDSSDLRTYEINDHIEEISDDEILLLKDELLHHKDLQAEVDRISASLYTEDDIEKQRKNNDKVIRAAQNTLMDPDILSKFIYKTEQDKKSNISFWKFIEMVVTIPVNVVKRFIQKRDHGLPATIIEEILRAFYLSNVGKAIWDLMKKDTVDSFGDNPVVFGGTSFLYELARQTNAENKPRITLIVHSAESIFISEFLDKAAQIIPDQKFDIVFLAPAATFEKTSKMITHHGEHRINNFRMFAMKDNLEKKDDTVPVYPHSLLYFISGVLEETCDTPLVGMERFFDRDHFSNDDYPDIKIVRDYIEADITNAVWSKTQDSAPDGAKSRFKEHGAAEREELTLGSVCHLLKEGYN